MQLIEAAATARHTLMRLAPQVAVLCGPASVEDRAYYDVTPDSARSHHSLSAALTRLGARCVRVVNVAEPGWRSQLDTDHLTLINLHGQPGEDGTIQGWLNLLGIRYVGSTVEASAIGLNKYVTKLVAAADGIRTPPYSVVSDGRSVVNGTHPRRAERICKPLRGGSSIGMFLMAPDSQLPAQGDWVIEDFLPGDDVTVTVIEVGGEAVALPAVVLRHGGNYYDLEAKMGMVRTRKAVALRPAHLLDSLAECERAAAAMHTRIGARHVSRCDFVVHDGLPYFLEINTIPGLSMVSNAAECAYAAGLSYDGFIALIVGAAL